MPVFVLFNLIQRRTGLQPVCGNIPFHYYSEIDLLLVLANSLAGVKGQFQQTGFVSYGPRTDRNLMISTLCYREVHHGGDTLGILLCEVPRIRGIWMGLKVTVA